MDSYRLQELQRKQVNGFVLIREEELLLLELTNNAVELLDDWIDTNY